MASRACNALVHVIYGAADVEVVRSWTEAEKLLEMDLTNAEKWTRDRAERDEYRYDAEDPHP